jgi:PAS domain S-box-containing protein
VGLAEYKSTFMNNQISGQELLELGPSDITDHLKITKLGHVKKLTKLIGTLSKNHNITNFLENLSDSSDNQKGDELSSTSGSTGNAGTFSVNDDIVFKCYHNEEIHLISMKRGTATYSELKLRIIEEYNCTKPVIKYKDTEGDSISIKKDSDFIICLQNAPVDSAIRLYISTTTTTTTSNSTPSSVSTPKDLDTEEYAVSSNNNLEDMEMDFGAQFLEDVVDAVVIITDDKIIRFFNKSAEKIFGYPRKEVLNQNVRVLMTHPHRANHNTYVQNYLNTGVAKIIGNGRMVEARAKDGSVFPIWLTIAESNWMGKHAFTGTIQDLRKQKRICLFTSLLDTLVDAMIIITGDDKQVKFMNKAAEKMFEYDREQVVGNNILQLMPDSFARNHDQYVDNYMKTGVQKVIGVGRKVEAKSSKGTTFPIWLSVSETKWAGQRAFIGTIQDLRSNSTIEHTLRALHEE